MLKKTLVGLVVCLGLSSGVVASDKLQENMGNLAGSLSSLQMGFLTNDKKMAISSAESLRKHISVYLDDKDAITKLLPSEIQYKSSIAINSAHMINKYALQIEKVLKDKNIRMINRQMRSQKAFLDIQNQCFRCHNLVRDWE